MLTLGRHVQPCTIEVYRDAPFVSRLLHENGARLTSAFILFPELDPPVRWDAIVGGDGIAEWAIPADEADIDEGTVAEVWLDGGAAYRGKVVRRGALPG